MNWLTSAILDRGNDLSTYFIPSAIFFRRSIIKFGQIPLWNPTQLAGMPYIADPQNYIFYLPSYLFALLPIKLAFLLLLLGHMTLAAIGTYNLALKVFNLKRFPALFAALAFALTPKMLAHLEAGHYTMLVAFSWLPWFMRLSINLANKPSIKKAVLASIILWLIYLNYINIAYFALLFFAAYSLFKIFPVRKKLNFKPYAISYGLFTLIFLGLISPVLLPQIELSSLSNRSLLTYEDAAQPLWSFSLFAKNLFFPFNLNQQQLSTERVIFSGIIILFLAVVGFIKYQKNDKWFFLSWTVFSLLYALGNRIPFFIFFYKYFPLIKWMRVTTRIWIISSLFIAVFAAVGLQYLLKKKSLRPLVFAILILGVSELISINQKIFSRPSGVDKISDSLYQSISTDFQDPFRVYCTTGCLSLQKLAELGVSSVSGNNPVQLKSFVDYLETAAGYQYQKYIPILPPYETFSQKPQPNSIKLGDLNTKYIASPYEIPHPSFEVIHQQNEFYLYKNLEARSVWIDGPAVAKITTYTPNKINLQVNNPESVTLTLSEMYYPGWKAVDQTGRELKVVDAKPFRSVKLDPSIFQITFYYFPLSLKIGLSLFTLTWISIFYAHRHPQLFLKPRPKRR